MGWLLSDHLLQDRNCCRNGSRLTRLWISGQPSIRSTQPRTRHARPRQAAFSLVVEPILESYQPDLIIVAAGFDAADGDPLGGCKVCARR